jgi:hypothetical protein
MIRVVHPGSGFFTYLDPGPRGQKDTRSRIRNTVENRNYFQQGEFIPILVDVRRF